MLVPLLISVKKQSLSFIKNKGGINMILKSLHIQGFTSYIDSKINFKENTIYTINGPNGNGKSSILEAITTALFYRARGTDNRGVGMDNLINNTLDKFTITLEFVINNNLYKIVRSKTRNGKHELDLFVNNEVVSEKINETQNKIYNIIKMDYDTFLDTVCIGQGLSSHFMQKKANERKEVFANILNLSVYDKLETLTKSIKKDKVNKLNSLEAKLNVLNESIDKLDDLQEQLNINKNQADLLNNKITDIKVSLNKVLEEKQQYTLLKQQQATLINHKNNLLNQQNTLINKLNELKNKYDTIYKDFNMDKEQLDLLKQKEFIMPDKNSYEKDKSTYSNYINELQEEVNKLSTTLTEYQTTIKLNNNKINELQNQYNQLDLYDKAVCEFCGNNITTEHKTQHLNSIQKQINELNSINKKFNIEQIKQSIADKKLIIADYNNKINECDKQINLANDMAIKVEKHNSKINILEANLIRYTEQVNELKLNKNTYTNELNIVSNQLKDFVSIQEIPDKTFNDSELQDELTKKQNTLNNLNGNIVYLQNQILDIENNKVAYNELTKQVSDLKVTLLDLDSLIYAFSKKGIQIDLINNVLPDIEQEVNNVLNTLFNGVSIEFTTQMDTKSNTTIETLDIIIHDKNGDRYYDTYSGGEKFRIDLALHIGLSKFLTKRADSSIEFFMIDEGLGSQDDEGKELFIDLINKLKLMFKQIFVITHIDYIKDAFDDKLFISKDNLNGSIIS